MYNFRNFSIIILVLLNINYINAQSIKTEQEIRFENFMNKTSYISIKTAGGLSESYSLVLPLFKPISGKSLAVDSVAGSFVYLGWASSSSINNDVWTTCGNNLSDTSQFGSINNAPLVFCTNDIERFRISESGKVGIGVNNPKGILSLKGGEYSFFSISELPAADTLFAAGQFSVSMNDTSTWMSFKIKKNDSSFANNSLPRIVLYNFTLPSIANCCSYPWYYDYTFSVPGVEPGDNIIINYGNDLPVRIVANFVRVNAANSVKIRFKNVTDTATPLPYCNIPSMACTLIIIKK